MIIVLIGYMGSGKSSIGRSLARILDYDFKDLDLYIEEKEGETISNIFKTKGEIYFRKKEGIYLNQLLNSLDNCVLALGGGTPCYGLNMKDILENDNTKSIYLKTSIPELSKRLLNETIKRPLISHLEQEKELIEFIGKHIFERTNFYNQSDLTVSTDNLTINEIVEHIILKLV